MQMGVVVAHLTNVMSIKVIVTMMVIVKAVWNVAMIIVQDFLIIAMIVATTPIQVLVSIAIKESE